MSEETAEDTGGESTLTVLIALGVNLAIAIMKLVAGLITGSAAVLSEAVHSLADTFTEVFLLTAVRRSARPADRRHPFGYGKERYFWSLLAAVSIFASGSVFAVVEGIRTVAGESAEQTGPWVGYLVLALAFAMESVSWVQSYRQVHKESAQTAYSLAEYLRLIDDPAPKTVLYEDSAALVGLVVAFAGLGLHQLTGSAVYDGAASILIGLLLAGVAFVLGYTNRGLLIGRQADPHLIRAINDRLRSLPEVDAVVDLLTMLTGAGSVLLCVRIDFNDELSVPELEHACVRIDELLRAEFTDLDEIFLEPVPRTDAALRDRVYARYGETAKRLNQTD